jgi:hypothetical protein
LCGDIRSFPSRLALFSSDGGIHSHGIGPFRYLETSASEKSSELWQATGKNRALVRSINEN